MKIELINIIGTFSEKAEHWMDSLINHLPNLTLAIIIFFLGFYAARFFKGITTRLLRSRQVKPSARNMLGNIVSIIIVLAFF